MRRQLRLIEAPPVTAGAAASPITEGRRRSGESWRLDGEARQRGLAGVERARRALEAARPTADDLPRAS